MSLVERVNQDESLRNWINWLTEPPAVCWSWGTFHLSQRGFLNPSRGLQSGATKLSCARHVAFVHCLQLNVEQLYLRHVQLGLRGWQLSSGTQQNQSPLGFPGHLTWQLAAFTSQQGSPRRSIKHVDETNQQSWFTGGIYWCHTLYLHIVYYMESLSCINQHKLQ